MCHVCIQSTETSQAGKLHSSLTLVQAMAVDSRVHQIKRFKLIFLTYNLYDAWFVRFKTKVLIPNCIFLVVAKRIYIHFFSI